MPSYYPPVGFHFLVVFGGFDDTDMRFQTVSGISTGFEFDTLSEGGENRFASHRLPKPPSYQPIKLKRGMLVGSKLLKWFTNAIESFEFEPRDFKVVLLNPVHAPLAAWEFINAYPSKWEIDSLDAMQNSVLAESVEMTYQYYRQIEVPTIPGMPIVPSIPGLPNLNNISPFT